MIQIKRVISILCAVAVIAAAVVLFPSAETKAVFAAGVETTYVGADVSSHNKTIDWKTAKNNGLDFAIIRIGYGDDYTNQDDTMAVYNMDQCEKYGIPYGVYIYSYAITEKEVDSEIAHTARMIQGRDPQLGVWFDMEDADGYKARHDFNPYTHKTELTNFCLRYMRGMKALGYDIVGVYANTDYFRNVLDYTTICNEGLVWLAHWNVDSPAFPYHMWQYTAEGTITGINGVCDLNVIPETSPLSTYVWYQEEPAEEITRQGAKIIYGDVNGDLAVNLIDLSLIQKHYLGQIALVETAFDCADVNGDGSVDLIDMALVQKHILGRIDLISNVSGETAVNVSGGSADAEQEEASAAGNTEITNISESGTEAAASELSGEQEHTDAETLDKEAAKETQINVNAPEEQAADSSENKEK